MARQKKAAAIPIVQAVEPPPPAYVPRTPISETDKAVIHALCCSHWNELSEYYGHDGSKPQHVQRRFQSILGAVDLETARLAAKKTEDVMFVHLMTLLAKHRIPGPDDIIHLEKRAKRAESLAKMLKARGDTSGARSQLSRAEELFDKVADLKRKKNNAPLDKTTPEQ